jgi:PKD repeat protein
MRKKLLALVFSICCLISLSGYGQITIPSIDAGPYGRGSSITIPIQIPAAGPGFNVNNTFTLWISGPGGNFSSETQIGTYSGFYATFINGIIPANLAAGTYKLRLKSSSPSNVIPVSPDIQVLAVDAPTIGATPAANLILGTDTYGWCGSAIAEGKSIVLKDNSSSPTEEHLILKNELTGASQEYPKGTVGFNLDNLSRAYYTITLNTETLVGGTKIKSSKSYLLLNTPSNVAVSGIGYGCIDPTSGTGANVSYQADIVTDGGIKNNFPGLTYRVTWGDGSTDIFDHPTLMRKLGVLSHNYLKTSCGQVPIDIGNGNKISNAFMVTVTAINPFCQSESGSITKYSKIFIKPTAKIDPSTGLTACLNVPLIIKNSSNKGYNSDCSLNMIYEWYIDNALVSVDDELKYTFTSPGNHTIKLVAKNDIDICQPSEDIRTICIQAQPILGFNFGGSSGAVVCLPGNLKATNTSIIDNTCNQDNTFQWTVTGGNVTYADGTTAASKEPVFVFATPGIYKVKLSVKTASCGLFSTPEQTVIVNGPPVSKLSPDVKLCNLGVYYFDNKTTGPTKTLHSGTIQQMPDTYKWTVDGGSYTYTDGTSDTSKYPHIIFNEFKTYAVAVTQKNNCTSVTATQQITFIPAPVVNAGAAQTICFEQTAQLNGTISGAVTSSSWIGGQGTFSPNRNALGATYTPTAAERAGGKVDLTLQAVTTLADPCSVIAAYTSIIITPQIIISSPATKATCKSVPLNYTITSNVPGTTYTWTATGSPNAGGFQATGTGSLIDDAITNSDLTKDATVVYHITPVSGACTGSNFDLTVTVAEIKNTISNATPLVCSGQQVTLTGNLPTGGNNNYSYVWESSSDGITWSSIPNEIAKDLTLNISQTLHFRRLVNSGDCSATSNTVDIVALPPLSNNNISGEQAICNGNLPTALTGSLPEGGDGKYVYQWQFSLDAGITWNDVSNAASKDYTPAVISTSTVYRRLVSTSSCSGKLQSISNSIKITVNERASASFTFAADKSCSPFLIDASNIVAKAFPDRNSTYTWYANGTVIGTGTTFPGYTIKTDSTTVLIKLIAESPFGCSSDTISHSFSTQRRVVASFSQDVTEGCGSATVQFRNTTPVLAGATYAWDFGNGNTATSASPNPQNYLESPSGRDTTYIVSLTVNTNCGSTIATSKVLVKALPQSVFSPNKTTGCSPLLVSFSNTSPGGANTYHYDFGDGTPAVQTTSKTPLTHTFVSGATKDFVVTMVTENACGRSQPTQYTIRITPNTILPELVVNSTEKEGCAPFTVHFQNNSTGGSNYVYDFGDGTTTGPTHNAPETVSHTFTKGGTFTVTLRASNSCSDTTTTEMITVYDQPQLRFTADQQTGCPGLNVKFKNESTGAVSYRWDFGDGSPVSTEDQPEHVYTGTNEYYTVTLTALNERGCGNTSTMSQFVHIIPTPVAKFNVNPSSIIAIPNYQFKFEDASENSPDKWEWNFGDGTTSTERSPSHTYPDTGKFQVTLRVSNLQNCFTTITKFVQITGVPGYLYLPNAFEPNSATPDLREFRAKGSGIASWNMQIFNKWGEMLWQTNKLDDGKPMEGWDGMYKSSLLPQGVYFWKVDVQMINKIPWKGMSYNGSAPKRTGIINLIR